MYNGIGVCLPVKRHPSRRVPNRPVPTYHAVSGCLVGPHNLSGLHNLQNKSQLILWIDSRLSCTQRRSVAPGRWQQISLIATIK